MTIYNWLVLEIVRRGLSEPQAEAILDLVGFDHDSEEWHMEVDNVQDKDFLQSMYFEYSPFCMAYIQEHFSENKELCNRFYQP